MRVNNPGSMIGFNGSVDANMLSQNLVTVSQVQTVINDLRSYVIDVIQGPNKNVNASYGYAWLTSNGKLDPNLIPKLAITETHTEYYRNLLQIAHDNNIALEENVDTITLENRFKTVLNIWLKSQINNNGKLFQEGDIIVVVTTATDEPIQNLIGSYIITNTPSDVSSEDFSISRLTHNDGLVTSINNQYPSSIGSISLNLFDVLKTNYEKILPVDEVETTTTIGYVDVFAGKVDTESAAYIINSSAITAEVPESLSATLKALLA